MRADDSSLEELARRAQRGDAASFDQIVIRLRDPLIAFLARRLDAPHDADDVAQETFSRAHRSLASYDPARRFSTWLFAIGKHTASNFQSTQQRRAKLEGGVALESSVDEVVDVPERGIALWERARRVLGDEAYRALWLRYACDYTVREIAHELGKTSVGTKVMLFRARAKLLEENT